MSSMQTSAVGPSLSPTRHTSSSPRLSPKFSRNTQKSASLDHEIFLQSRNNVVSSVVNDWKLLHPSSALYAGNQHSSRHNHHHVTNTTTNLVNLNGTTITTTQSQCNLPRASSTSSLTSSTRTNSHYQEYKADIINQGKCLCGQYVRARLRRAGFLNRKAIQRLRTILEPSSSIVYEVFPALNSMGEELERMHPRVYSNVSRQLSRAPFGELRNSDTAPMLMNLVAKELFRTNITWGKIISIFSVCGGFAIDCVRQGHYDYLQFLIEGLTEIIEDDLAYWLVDNGGWLGLQKHLRPQVGHLSFLGWLTIFVTLSSGVYIVSSCVKHIGYQLYSLL